MRVDIDKVKVRQEKLRGENGTDPLFVSPSRCSQQRLTCHGEVDKVAVELARKAVINADRIKRLENYARWTLQDKGLKIDEINRILDPV